MTKSRQQLFKEVRALIGMPDTKKTFFSGAEMIKICSIVNPSWKRKPKLNSRGQQVIKKCFGKVQKAWETSHEDILVSGVPNWKPQKTKGTHPEPANLNNIIRLLRLEKQLKTKKSMEKPKPAFSAPLVAGKSNKVTLEQGKTISMKFEIGGINISIEVR
jgi:hypothetical protein